MLAVAMLLWPVRAWLIEFPVAWLSASSSASETPFVGSWGLANRPCGFSHLLLGRGRALTGG